MLWIVLAAAAAVFILSTMPGSCAAEKAEPFTRWKYAHRGLHDNSTDAPENSMRAFGLAVENGYGIELDLQLTADGSVVVFHDDTLERVCGVKTVIPEKTLEELGGYRLCGTDQRIPLFTEVLAAVDGKVPLIIELKYQKNFEELCEKTVPILDGYHGMYCVESFHPGIVRWFKKHRPELTRGILAENPPAGRGSPALWLASELCYNISIRPHFVAYCQEQDSAGFRIWRGLWKAPCVAWTVRSEQREKELSERYGVIIFEGYKSPKQY